MVLPAVIQEVVNSLGAAIVPNDTVITELKAIATKQNIEPQEMSVAMAIYILGFITYDGFGQTEMI